MKKLLLEFIPLIVNIAYFLFDYYKLYVVFRNQLTVDWLLAIVLWVNIISPLWLVLINYKNLGKNIKYDVLTLIKIYIIYIGNLIIFVLPHYSPEDLEGAMICKSMWVSGSIVIIVGSIIISAVNRLLNRHRCRKQ